MLTRSNPFDHFVCSDLAKAEMRPSAKSDTFELVRNFSQGKDVRTGRKGRISHLSLDKALATVNPTVGYMYGIGESMPLNIIIPVFPQDQCCRKDLLLFALQVHRRGRRHGGSGLSRKKGDFTSDLRFPSFELQQPFQIRVGVDMEKLYLSDRASGGGRQ